MKASVNEYWIPVFTGMTLFVAMSTNRFPYVQKWFLRNGIFFGNFFRKHFSFFGKDFSLYLKKEKTV
jgi:hypothetical protein